MKRLTSELLIDLRIRFPIVGSVNALVDFGYLFSLALSYAIAITMAFFLYRHFVFPVKGRILRDFARFVGVYVVTIAINALTLPLLVEIAGIPPLLAQAVILVVSTLINFLGHRNSSFHRKPSESDDDTARPETTPTPTTTEQ